MISWGFTAQMTHWNKKKPPQSHNTDKKTTIKSNLRTREGSRRMQNSNPEVRPPLVKLLQPLMHHCGWAHYDGGAQAFVSVGKVMLADKCKMSRSRNVNVTVFSINAELSSLHFRQVCNCFGLFLWKRTLARCMCFIPLMRTLKNISSRKVK